MAAFVLTTFGDGERTTLTLRISIEENPRALTMKLEGRIAGPWVSEVSQAWHSLAPSLGVRKLSLDLSGVTYVNADGMQLLREIHEKTDAEFLADSPLTKYFAQEAMQVPCKAGQKGD
ncbi:MAG: hypothetical protein LAN84_08400 [Acidobacteriia bacterium]|nr:hypothetical protein [Terriglobia bacterium]